MSLWERLSGLASALTSGAPSAKPWALWSVAESARSLAWQLVRQTAGWSARVLARLLAEPSVRQTAAWSKRGGGGERKMSQISD